MAELYWPFDPAIINYGFGYPPGYGGFHNGVDFPVPQGTMLRATVSGTVRNVDAGQSDGWGVDIITPDGWKVRMWHVSKFLVPNGSRVEAGQDVALSGGAKGTPGAGNATGAHLHWGVALDGRDGWVDPAGLNPKSFDTPIVDGDDEVKQIEFNGRRYLITLGAIQSIPVGEDVGDMYGSPINLGTNFERGDAMNRVCRAHGIPDWAWQQVGNGSDAAGNDHSWNAATGFYKTVDGPTKQTVNVDAIAQAVKDAIGNIDVNVDGIAQAIADKIDCGNGSPCVTTKADIIESITANYPEDM